MLLPQHRQVSTPESVHAVYPCAAWKDILQSNFTHACKNLLLSTACNTTDVLMLMLRK